MPARPLPVAGGGVGLALFAPSIADIRRPRRPACALTTLLAAMVACAPGAMASAFAQEAAKTGRGVLGSLSRQYQGLPPGESDAGPGGRGLIRIQAQERFTVGDLVGIEGRPLPVPVQMPPFDRTDYVLLSFRGLPPDFALSSGFRTAEAWLVSAHDLDGLELIPPKKFVGSFRLEVQLIRGQTMRPAVRNVVVDVRPDGLAETDRLPAVAVQSHSGAQALPAKVPDAEARRVSPSKEAQLMETASAMMAQNDIAAARLIYARLAREGSEQAALIMAQTYDPAFLSNFAITGLQPDMEKARYWYGVAAGLGNKDAPKRLLALDEAAR